LRKNTSALRLWLDTLGTSYENEGVKVMLKRILKKHERGETLFDRLCRAERGKQLAQSDALFFGLSVLLAIYATQNMFTIQ